MEVSVWRSQWGEQSNGLDGLDGLRSGICESAMNSALPMTEGEPIRADAASENYREIYEPAKTSLTFDRPILKV
jgi:hypothetical protein